MRNFKDFPRSSITSAKKVCGQRPDATFYKIISGRNLYRKLSTMEAFLKYSALVLKSVIAPSGGYAAVMKQKEKKA